jgi:hypothetical protein
MIIETVVSTVNENKEPHFAAVGVEFMQEKAVFNLYKKSRTFSNLKNKGSGIINLVDKAEYLLKAAVGSTEIDFSRVGEKELYYLTDCCNYYQFRLINIEDQAEKYLVKVEITAAEENRKYIGFNRANNLLVEAAVIASRIGITKTKNDLRQFINQNRRVINKTGDKNTQELLKFLERNI